MSREERRDFIEYLLGEGIDKRKIRYILDGSNDVVILKDYPYVVWFIFYGDSKRVGVDITYLLYGDEQVEIEKRIPNVLMPTKSEYDIVDGYFHLVMLSPLKYDRMYQRYREGRIVMDELIDWHVLRG